MHGFTLVELMVGVLVALLVGIAAMSTARFYTAPQREGIGTSLAVASATSALTAISEDIAQAGLGFIPTGPNMCGSLNLSRGASSWTLNPFSPVRITRDGDSDIVDVIYGSEVGGGADVRLAAPSDLKSAQLASALPVAAGQAVLLAPMPSALAAAAANGICTVRTVTSISTGVGAVPMTLEMSASGSATHNQVVFSQPTQYLIDDRVSILGRVEWHRFRVVDGNLMLEWPMEGRSAVLMRSVVAFRAQYGVAGGAGTRPTTITAWNKADATNWTSVGTTNLSLLRALRLSVLVRSTEPQRPDSAGDCTATPTSKPPQLLGAAPTLPTGWECFYYRTTSVTTPLRNLAWGMNP
ncbi:PilW family protein [Caldimonas sp. KR1-144]|uniref:PilW family protein n=1 Tax=Caldimonas sp. KR1-144 TaxID=3400911 RepID=UPI003BFB4532